MTTKRTHGPCTCLAGNPPLSTGPHAPDCQSLYPAQQEPDALTRLVRHIRLEAPFHRDEWTEQALSIISEARDEQRKALVRAKNEGLEEAATRCAASCGAPEQCSCDEHFWAEAIRALKEPEE